MIEKDIASKCIINLREWNWEIYQEVAQHATGGAPRCDIIATQNKIRWAIECKASFNFKVLAQARYWRDYCHYSSICVPKYKHNREYRMAEQICNHFGIGILVMSRNEDMVEMYKPRLNRKALDLKLYEDQKIIGTAGSRSENFYTNFGRTKIELINKVKQNPGIEFKELIQMINHHYRTLSAAKSCLRNYIGTSVIPELKIEVIDNKLCVFPKRQKRI